ncbi:Muscle M-line assembly protein unc-89 [Caenorhabditis elegans]|nr:Muscle M-line assembly protein unc-89 [Caenorhabditis elegans]CCD63868.1 Muscle M-line assembly protein unc-89 [Caenorhabditis elegans]|eukprot:NP_001020988.1 Muscle M-line assembly protein unc-89 [Caenorhabditis elegans]
MASRRQKQFDRKYSSYRKFTATEDVNYSTHSSRSSYRSESLTSRTDGRGRSTSSEIIAGSESRSYPVYIAIQDYTPDKEDVEAIPLEQGQIVEVLDKKNSVRWLVRTKARPPRSGWVPGSYFETPTEFYKQRRRTREIENVSLSDEQAALVKRDQVYHELLRSEEEFVSSLRTCVDDYIKVLDDPEVPEAVKKNREELTLNIPELYNFHANVMLKGLNYYSDDPGKVGQTFVRLEKDFESHVEFYKQYADTLKLLEEPEIKRFFEGLSAKNDAGASSFVDHVKEIADRMVQYQNYFKEFVKYSARAHGSSKSIQKALELVTTIPQRVHDLEFTNNLKQHPGDTGKLGRIIRHDAFQVWEGDEPPKLRYVFLFRNKIMFTEQDASTSPPSYTHYSSIRLDKYNIRQHTTDEDTIVLQPQEPGLPSFRIKPKDFETSEYVRKAWLRDIAEEQEKYAAERDAISMTATSEMTASSVDFDMNASDQQSEFSEWSGSRKSSLFPGPEEGGPPRKKVKSPPVISPTGSSTSIYSGGSSSIDWTTTGTTLEMQGTRVTRTQYGFRTLQESSAKMCLKVTGYPLPDITWYKDDVQLHEDERHTFYSDEDGFFAMTIDPVQVTDTGRYTCMATNEYGQASTSAFFRVLKVEKEAAPPAFVTKLRDKECKEGDVIDFECEVEGWPEPELVWLVDDQPLRPSHDFRLQYDGQTAKLEIRDAQPDDTGVYTVKIQNEFGSIESKAELFVQADPDKNHVAPEFQATIEYVECDEGEEVRFKSVITGDPNPEIIWFINGKPLSESEKVKFISEDGICILTIKDVTRHFDGMVTCQGSNRLGSASCDGRLKVRVPPAPPTFNKPLEDKTVQEKSTVVFEVDVSGWPEPTLTFTLCGKELKNGEEGVEIVGHDGFYRISIPNTSMDKHDGEIVAKAQNEHGTAESRARLTVEQEEEESRSAPTFLKDIEDQTVKTGEFAVFETTVRGNPNPEVTWFINGHKMDQGSPGVKIEAHNHDHKLTIDSAQYAGTVLCRAENAVGRFETKARLVVLAPEKQKKPPKFVEILVDKTETVDNTVVFEVRVEGEPKPTVTWYLKGEELKQSDRVEIREFDGSIKISIKNIKIEDAGEIRAVATNSEGSDETKAKLTVQKKPFAPEFDLRPVSLTVEKGSEAVFSAHAFGIPLPTYEWSVNGRKVRDGQEGARVTRDESTVDGASILTIDTATYYSEVNHLTISVVAENTLGAEETGAQLTIEPKKPPAPKLTRDLKLQTVNKTDLAHFEVVVEHATECKWFLDGKEITTAQGVTVSKDDQFEFRCSIDTTMFGSGTVSVVASNAAGSVETKTELKVLETPKETKKPEFTDKLRDMEVTKGDTVQMDVIALHSPLYKWYQNGNLLEDGKNGVTIKNEENKSSLIIPNAQDSGKITVEASNEVGSSESSAQLTVNPPSTTPIVVDGPKSVTIKETETAEFKATISGFPAPTVKWTINEKIVEESRTITTIKTEDVYTLKISNAKIEQTGTVKVTAQNSAGQDSKQADLKVEPNVKAPKFKSQLTDKVADEGEPLRWNLELDGPSPGTEVSWLLNGQPLTKSDTVQVVDHGDGTYHVTIAEAKPEMSGTLTAKAKNAAGECETSAKVTVNGGNKKPEFVQAPQNHETTLEESVKFSAIVTGKPMPNVTWYLNNKKLIQSEEVKVKYVHETGKTSIRIQKPLMEHNGTIRVEAENVSGKVQATAQLKVDKKTEVPKFTTNMDDRQVKEGEDVKFTANVEGYPEPSVAWTLNGEPVSKHPNITVTDKDGEHTIEISAVTPEQAGELSCEATNPVGSKKRDVQLAVKKVGDAPTFAKNLEDRLITEGELTLMDAKLNIVKPKPKITWLKDGVEITSDGHYKIVEEEDGSLKLSILQTKLEDKGRITIKAESEFGVAECSASLGVVKGRPMAKPAFQSDIAPINLTEGDTLECKLLITGDPTPFVKWYIGTQLVCATEDTEISNANGVYTMKIHGVTADMTGKIKCVAYNKAGEVSTEGPLKVVAPIPVEFETSLCDATCREGDTLKLRAVLLGEPEPVVSWYVNGKKLEESQNIKIHSEKGTYTVTIKDITCDYSGQVVCEAINEYGKATSEATLLVLPRGEPPDFLEWLSNVRARTGTKVVHKVVFTGDPKPSLTWYINNKEILNSDLYTIVTDDKTSTLTINSFNPDVHVGEIICKAENDAGEVSCTANMITYTSDMFSESESEAQAEEFVGDDLTEDESLREEMHRTPTPVMAPKFITKIKDTKAKKGHSAVFECVVPDTKGVCCKWLKDGKEIELIARIRVQTRTGPEGHITQELVLDNVTPEDAGKYTCIVENTAGKDTCEATLTVIESLEKKSEKKAPEFIVALQDKTTKTSEKVVLECKVIGEPKPKVSWLHDNKTITQESITVESVEGVERVTITSSELSHQGKYTCIAENTEGTSKTEAFLTVQGEAPVFTKELQNKELSIGEKLVLSCSVKGSPQPHVDFYSFSETTKVETKITSSSRIAIEHDQTNTHWRMVISQITKEDIVSYKAIATNSIGTATSTSKITTKVEAPVFEQGLKKTSVKEKEEIKMEVKVGGSAPDVEWFKDDKPVSEDGNHEMKKNPETGVFTLVVKQAATTDAGKYTAKASNPAGTAESSAEAEVTQSLEKPTFVRELVTTEVKINETATLSVTVKGVPDPSVEWLKDGQPVQTDSSHVIAKVEGSGSYSITIKDARLEDSGKYACRATNPAGEAKTEANFAVVKNLVPPEFVEKLSPLEVKEKESTTLSVKVVGTPEPSVEWFKDDTPISIDNVHVIQKQTAVGSFSLTINDARQGDVGIYSCRARNEAGEALTTANFGIIRDSIPPEFTQKLRPLEVREQETLDLKVTVIGTPVPNVEWFKDDKPINIDNSHIFAKDEGSGHHTLTIKQARGEDVGVYTCKATNEAGEAKTTANMAVQEEIEAPLFVQGLKPYEVEQGKPAELVVRVEGKPEPEVKWFKDGVPIAIDNQHVIEKKGENGSHTLVIKDTNNADFGKYTCQATNKAGKDETVGELKIPKYSFEKQTAEEVKPLFIEPLKETFAVEGDTVVLECKVNKESHPQIKFFKNDQPVEIGQHMQLEVLEDGNIKLTIQNAKKEDVGAYRCEAVNVAGKANTNADLKIQFAAKVEEHVTDESGQLEEIGQFETVGDTASSKTDTGRGAPEFVELLRSCTVTEKQQAILKCKVKGEPRPKIKWTKEGKEVEMSARVRAEHKDDGTLTLTFDNVTQADAGEYRCEAENEYGSAWTEGPIIVTLEGAPKIDGEAPDFLQPVKPAVVTVGETAVLEGKISGKPKPSVKWYKNGEELKPSDRVKIENLDDGTQRLTVTNAKLDDMDEYRCEASNEFGDVWSDVTLTVKEPAQVAPGFFKELSAIQVKETETAKFECKVSGTKPDVKWFKDGTPLKEDKRVHFESTDDGTQRLVIEDSKTDDQGNYRIEVSNDAGVANSKVPLTVVPSETLKIKKGLTDVNVTQGTKILLSVEVEGKPKTVKWYKGTETVTSSQTTKIVQVTESEYKLEIESAEMSDTGAYRVVLSTDSFSVESSATVTVTKAAEKISLPSFKKGLADQSVPKGTPLVLEVEIEGKPKDVKWYKNGDEIKDGKVEDLGNGKYRLTIPDFQEKDVGEYSVTAANEAGEIESKAKVNVSAKPEIVSGLVPTTVKQGETATFNVKVKGPVKGVKWYKNGKEIPDAKTKDNGDGSYSLEIPNAQVEDAADYKVVVSNDAGDADSSAALTVKLADDGKDKVKPEIVSGLIPTTVKQGETATFNVKVKGPVKQVKWYKNGKEIPNAKAKDNGDGSYSLEIPNAQLDDTADYKVVVSNDAGDADSSAALTVKLPGIAIVKGLEDAEVPKGKKAVLQVETNKKPKEIKWYKNGKEITPSDKAQPGSDGDNKPQLVIPDAGDDDAAEYKVVLTDEDGNTADSSCALTVKLPAKEPKIIKGLEDQVVSIGSPIKLEIETSGSPKTVKWYKNGKELPGAAAKTIKIQKIDDNKYVLEIPSSVVEDTGDYKVEVANEAGSANSSGKITVEPKITFLKPLKDQSITEGENAEFSVETNTKPRIVKWYKNGQEIKPNSRFIIEQKTDTKYQLVIKNAVRDDADTYKIVLENTAGEAESSAQLTVKKAKAGLCKIVKGLEDQVVAKGAKMVFEVKIQGEPEDVRWLRDANVISAGANAIIEKIDDTTYRLIIPSADLKDAGEYTVEVINESGKAKSDAKGEVDEKPEIVRGLENIEIPEGDDDVFKVEVSAPVRQVKWYKNDQEIKPNSHLEAKKIGPKKYELAINRAQLDDGADYKVVLSNAAGDCDSSAALTVVKPNVLKIVDGLKDVDVEEPQPVELKVKVEGIPKVIKWYKNGQELKPDADGFKFEEKPESGEFSLTIPSSKKSDGGAYRVVLGNDKGEVYSGSVVHVKSAKSSEPTSGANFLSPLKDTEVEEGDMLTLQCTIAGEPFPEVIWEKDGVVLQKDDRITMRVALDGTATLRIRSAKKSDIGQYRVTAKNEAGSATSDCKVTVTEQGEQPSKPKFVIPLKTGAALPGDKKEFNVKVRGLPKPTLQWFLNGIPIKFDDRITLDDMADGNYCLTIRDVREEDFGTLKCIAKNENGTDETVCEFQQGAGHDDGSRDDLRYPPRFNVPLWDRRIPVGDPMFIECHVDANPTAEVEWFKDGKKIEHTAHTEIRNTVDGACRIKIIPFEESDIGVYMCVAVNELGQAETQATYQVEILEHVEEEKRREYAPKINPPLEDKTVNGGQPIRLSCKVDAIPRASVVWYKDGLPLRADSRTSIQYEEDGTATLAINDSTEEDIGAYRCVATNAHGTINTSCSVNVKVPKQEVKKEGEEPFFTKGLVDLWADRGDSFTLKCAVTGDPFPEIKWYRNGQLLRNGPRTVIETSPDGSCSLTVNESTMSDEGIYRCEAENAHGKAKTQATAHVQMALGKTEKPKMDEGKPPKFILELSDMSVSLGNVIDLECKVTGLPNPSVKWSKDGGPLIEDSRFEWSNEASKGVYQLRIKNATVHDEGTYRCVATNENGSATTKSFVRMDDGLGSGVVTASQPPRFTLKMGDVRTTEGQPLKLECKVDASPLPEMVWYKDGAIVTPSDRIQISLSPDGVATLLIPSCVYDDDGIYRVIATNPSGTAQDKGTATVKKLPRDSGARRSADRDVFDANKAPKLMEPLENIRIPEKQSFRLRCKFSGDPKPTIKWFKDGERVFPYGRLQLIESPDGVCELVVDSATRQDAGGYRCVAENTYGSARTSCDVNVIRGDRKPRDIDSSIREGKAPGFTTPLTIRRAKPGDSVTFECLPFGNPFPSIKWLKDGLELFSDEKIKMEAAADGTQRLILSDVTFLSEGYFRCVATNEHGTASTKAELVIEGDRTIGSRPLPEVNGEPEECKPRIRRGLYNMSIHEGNVVEMIVCATGIPTPTVKWYKDGQEIVGDGPDGKRVIFTDERGIHHLVIVNASPDDEGEYSLEATNKLGSAKTEGSLNIIRPRHIADADERGGMPFPPGFVRQLKNKHVFNHMPTIFDCLVVGHPAPEVEWFHNGKKIVPGGRIKIQSCGGGSHALIILDTTLEDAGEYVATAKNSHGSASSSAVLDVTVPFLDSIKFNGEIDVTPYLTEEYGFKKLNTASLPTPPDRGPFIKEVTGHYLTLSWIPTKRAPPRYPQVTYVIEIRELPEKQWSLLEYNIPEPVCKVRNLELGKSYQFRVRAENIYGISDPSPASPPSRLMAPPQPVFDRRTNKVIPLLDPYAEKALDMRYSEQYACAPWFSPGVVEKRYCAENDTLTIVLNVSGFPDPDIKWKFRGWDIDTSSPTSKCKVYTYGGSETTLAITGFSKENVGQYQCFAKNDYGDAQQNIMVDLATRPNFIQPLVNKTFSSAQPMRMDVRVDGEPFPELKWMKEWRPIVESSRIKFVQDGPYLCSLIINDPMWRDSGIYSCVAVNDAGQATTSCTVTVEAEGDYNDVELPRRRVTIESRRVRELYEISEKDEK